MTAANCPTPEAHGPEGQRLVYCANCPPAARVDAGTPKPDLASPLNLEAAKKALAGDTDMRALLGLALIAEVERLRAQRQAALDLCNKLDADSMRETAFRPQTRTGYGLAWTTEVRAALGATE